MGSFINAVLQFMNNFDTPIVKLLVKQGFTTTVTKSLLLAPFKFVTSFIDDPIQILFKFYLFRVSEIHLIDFKLNLFFNCFVFIVIVIKNLIQVMKLFIYFECSQNAFIFLMVLREGVDMKSLTYFFINIWSWS